MQFCMTGSAEDLDVGGLVVAWVEIDVVPLEVYSGVAFGARGYVELPPCDGTTCLIALERAEWFGDGCPEARP